MDDVEVTYDSSLEGWASNPAYYWPKTGYLTFVAYSPSDADMTMGADGTLSLTNFTRNNDAASQYDLMYSDLSIDRQSSRNDYSGTESNEYNGVDILFHHALSSIKFTAAKLADYTGTTITIKSITLGDVNSTANLTVTPTVSSTTAVWNSAGTPIDYTVFSGTTALTTTATSIGTNLILIPQSFSDETAEITVTYSIKHQDSDAIEQTHTVAIKSLTTEWQKGYRYTYNITIGLDKIYFAPIVESWQNGTVTPNVDDIIENSTGANP